MANTFKFGNGNWAVKDGAALAYNDENGNFKPLPFDFTRGSSATRVNKQGLIETVPSGKPRIDFLNNTSGHLLLEPLRRNLATDSNLSLLSGGSSGSITTTGDGSSTDLTLSNGLTGKRLTVNSSGRAYLNISCTVVSGTQYTISIYAENYLGADQSNFIDILSGGGGEDFSSSLIENGRIQGTFTASSTTVVIRIGHGTTSTRTGSYSVDISGIQLEDSGNGSDATFATSLIQTSGTIVTRSAEEANGAGNNQVFDNDTGVWFIDLERIGIQSGRAMMLANSSGSEQIRLHFDDPNEEIRFRDGKASFATIGGNISMGVGTRKKVALKIDGTTLKVFADGSQIGSNYTRPTAFDIHLMYAADDAFKLFDTRFYNTALSDSELQALTS